MGDGQEDERRTERHLWPLAETHEPLFLSLSPVSHRPTFPPLSSLRQQEQDEREDICRSARRRRQEEEKDTNRT